MIFKNLIKTVLVRKSNKAKFLKLTNRPLIKQIEIKNYKSFDELVVEADEFNIIIGQNNIGKSSIFEALLLWKQCYDCLTLSSGKGFYKLSNNSIGKKTNLKYIRYNDLEFLRLTSDRDLFNNYSNKNKTIGITLYLQFNKRIYNLGFEISCPENPGDVYFRINYINESEFHRFAKDFNGKVSDAIYIHKTQPIALIPSKEPYMNKAQVRKKITRGKSYEVLRNKIVISEKLLKTVESEIQRVFDDSTIYLRSKSSSTDEYIHLEVEIGGITKELHLQGSGLLQIAEIFSSIEFFDSALNIILLDEPDAHIHTKLLLNLLEKLKTQSENNQIFIITHNDKFVDYSSDKGKLYFFDSKVKYESKLLKPLNEALKLYVKKELGDIITNLDEFGTTNKLIMVEGKNDIKFWKKLHEKYLVVRGLHNTMPYFIHLNGKDEIVKKVEHFLYISKQIKSTSNVMVIFDKDFSTHELNRRIITDLKKVIKAENKKAMTYSGYCLESTFFSQPEKIAKIISMISGVDQTKIEDLLALYFTDLKNECSTVGSLRYIDYKSSFKSQQINRQDLKSIEFDDFITDVKKDTHLLLTKIEVGKLITKINVDLLDETTQVDFKIIMDYYIENLVEIGMYNTHVNILDELHRLGN